MYPTAKTLAGQRRQVWSGKAKKTRGKLRSRHLKVNRRGTIVSRKKSAIGRRNAQPLAAWR